MLRGVRQHLGPAAERVLTRAPWAVLVVPAIPLIACALVLKPRFPATGALVDDWAGHALYLTVMLLGWFGAKSGPSSSAAPRHRGWRPAPWCW